MAGEGLPLIVIQRQLGHSNLAMTSVYSKATTPRSSTPSTPIAHGGSE
jgi:integrase